MNTVPGSDFILLGIPNCAMCLFEKPITFLVFDLCKNGASLRAEKTSKEFFHDLHSENDPRNLSLAVHSVPLIAEVLRLRFVSMYFTILTC